MSTEIFARLKTVSTTKNIAAASAYHAEDVLSESASNGQGTSWIFSNVTHQVGGGGEIRKSIAISKTTAVTPRLVLDLYTRAPSCELDDHAASTGVVIGDAQYYVGRIDFPAMEDIGTGSSQSVATPGNSNLPLAFLCEATSRALYGVAATKDAFTQTAADALGFYLLVAQAARA